MHLLSKSCCYPLSFRSTLSKTTPASTLPVLKPSFPVLLNNSQSHGVCCKVATSPEGFEVDVPTARSVPKVLIAGGGIGGLVVALGLLKRGFDVQVFERDLTTIRGEDRFCGIIRTPLSNYPNLCQKQQQQLRSSFSNCTLNQILSN